MHRPMRRVAIVGPGGAGKSTGARRLGELTCLPVVHLDEHYWHPGWVPTPDDEWREIVSGLAAADEWILDGNYSRTIDVRVQVADTVLLFDFSPLGNLARAMWRSIANHGQEIQAPGCPEHIDLEFWSWILHYRTRSRPRVLEHLEARGPDCTVHVLRRPRDAARFLASVTEA
jgi:adenylate kinase family enzyme